MSEASYVALGHWLQAIYLVVSSKWGVSSNQLRRTLGIAFKSVWFMSHRIREAMAEGHVPGEPKLSGGGITIEADKT